MFELQCNRPLHRKRDFKQYQSYMAKGAQRRETAWSIVVTTNNERTSNGGDDDQDAIQKKRLNERLIFVAIGLERNKQKGNDERIK